MASVDEGRVEVLLDRARREVDDGLLPSWGNGTLFVGSKGMLLADYDKYALLPAAQFKDFTPPPKTIATSIGHHEEWIRAAKGGEKALCDFSYSGPLTEAVLLGTVAYRSSAKLTWDPVAMKWNAITTTNRNFRGRMGSNEAGVHLANAWVAAAAAVAGEIVDPAELAGP